MQPDTNRETLFIARNQDKYIQYDFEVHGKTPQLVRREVDSVSPEQEELVTNLRQSPGRPSELPAYLRYVTVLNSVRSGTGLSNMYYFNVLLPLFKDFGIPHVCVATTSADSIRDHAQSFCTSGTVVLFGGDTTINEFVNGLPREESKVNLQLRLMVIPTGTGNALANSIDCRSPIQAIRAMFCGDADHTWKPLTAFPIKLPQYSAPRCALVCFSLGLHAGLVGDSDTPEMRRLGNERFKIAAENLVARDPIYYASVPGIDHEAHSYLLITSVKELEPKFEISPRGGKGRTWMIEIPKVSGKKFMEIMMAAYQNGAHISAPEVTYRELKEEVRVQLPDQPELERRCCIDGEISIVEPGEIWIGVPSFRWNGWDLLIWAK